jgi:ribonuclease BN (tRNA processing enzyme)
MRLIPLGTNGYIPTHGRQTMCFLVRFEDRALLLDAGTGVARLLEPRVRELLEGVEQLDVILSHFHLDHVIGLSYLPGVWPERPVRVFAPAPPMVDADPREALCRLIHPPLFPIPLAEFPMRLAIEPVASEALEIGGLELRLRSQDHPGGSVGMRVGEALAYVTDTTADDGTAHLADGVDVLVHEVWGGSDEEGGAAGHSSAEAVARLASRAGARRLMPAHHHPSHTPRDLDRLVADLAATTDAEVVLPEEGRVYRVGTAGAVG